LCIKLVIYKDYTEMLHGQQNIKFSSEGLLSTNISTDFFFNLRNCLSKYCFKFGPTKLNK